MKKFANFAEWKADDVKAWVVECLRERGKVLTGENAHYCHEWDGLTVDETTPEWDSCLCYRNTKTWRNVNGD